MSIQSLNHLSNAEYRSYGAVSQSDLKAAKRNPQLYYETYLREPASSRRSKPATTAEQQWGMACETFLRTQQLPEDVVVIPAEALNKDGHRKGAAWTEFAAANVGKTLVTRREYDQQFAGLEDAFSNVMGHAVAKMILQSPTALWSQRFAWECPETGLPLKAELDLVDSERGILVDVKTAADTDQEAFGRAVYTYGYDIQAAQYLEAVQHMWPEQQWTYGWIVIRNKAPHEVEVYDATDELLAYGRRRLMAARQHFADCVESGTWKSATHGISVALELPAWVRSRDAFSY